MRRTLRAPAASGLAGAFSGSPESRTLSIVIGHNVCGQAVPDSQCGFRMMHRDLLPAMAAIATTKFDYETEMLVVASRRGCKIGAVPISTIYGDEKSKIHPVRDTIRFYQMMARFKRESKGG